MIGMLLLRGTLLLLVSTLVKGRSTVCEIEQTKFSAQFSIVSVDYINNMRTGVGNTTFYRIALNWKSYLLTSSMTAHTFAVPTLRSVKQPIQGNSNGFLPLHGDPECSHMDRVVPYIMSEFHKNPFMKFPVILIPNTNPFPHHHIP